jgi:glycosyltransferase involved in cell wall biosynthesis
MNVVYITSGAAGMYCGSCMRDNTLARALHQWGHGCVLVPTYTPIRTDEPDESLPRVFFGGISVYLQQKYAWARRLPAWLDRWLSQPWLLRQVSKRAMSTRAEELADLTISMLRGMDGHQRLEVVRLTNWLREHTPNTDVVILTNALISGLVPHLRQAWGKPIWVTLQGDDIYLESLPAAARAQAIELMRRNCADVAGFFLPCRAYADFMSGYLGLARERMHIVPPGIDLNGYPETPPPVRSTEPLTIGYLARIAPEKGLHVLVEACNRLAQRSDGPAWRLRAAGYLAPHRRDYLTELLARAKAGGWGDRFEYLGEPDHAGKLAFLSQLDLFSVPTTYREPKGLYLLEALGHGIPSVQPAHGSFPEMLEATGGGCLVPPEDPTALAEALAQLLRDPARRAELGRRGLAAVREHYTAQRMAAATIAAVAG